MTTIPHRKTTTTTTMTMEDKNKNKNIYIIAVDSRGGKDMSDMSCYVEHVCLEDYFNEHIAQSEKIIDMTSQVANLCGIHLKMYFRLHSPSHRGNNNNNNNNKKEEEEYHDHTPMSTNVNGIATLLTFDIETGYYNHLIFGKAYVLVDDGKTPFSIQQLWGLVEFITESKDVYHRDHRLVSEGAYQELCKEATKYRNHTWLPRCIYESRHHLPLRKHVYYYYYRYESGLSDQATCSNHGQVHIHHDGHHDHVLDCCHDDDDEHGSDDIRESSSSTTTTGRSPLLPTEIFLFPG